MDPLLTTARCNSFCVERACSGARLVQCLHRAMLRRLARAHCRMVHDTDIIELELKSKKFTLNLRKKEAIQAEQPVVQVRALNMAAIGGTAPPSRRAV